LSACVRAEWPSTPISRRKTNDSNRFCDEKLPATWPATFRPGRQHFAITHPWVQSAPTETKLVSRAAVCLNCRCVLGLHRREMRQPGFGEGFLACLPIFSV